MFVSIVIPMFNEENNILKLLSEIEIALKTYNKYEIIIVDDNSIDSSYEKVEQYKSNNNINKKKN